MSEVLKKEFIPKYLAAGEQKFYNFLLIYALNKLVLVENGTYKGVTPELQFLDCHDRFMILHRREGEDVYLELARIFRKAAHRIYRIMLKKKMTDFNPKFLHSV